MNCNFQYCGLCYKGKCVDKKEHATCKFVKSRVDPLKISLALGKSYYAMWKWMG